MEYHARSASLNLIFNGRIIDILTPWHIIVNTQKETITITKRNYFLIGVDCKVYSFRYIRNIDIDEHLFGADISIKVSGSRAQAFSLTKRQAQKIKTILTDYNSTKKGKTLIFA